MKTVYIVESLRTPFGSFAGCLSDVPAATLAQQVMEKILKNTGLAGTAIDEVILGQVLQGGAAQAPARQAMRGAGIADSAHAMTINKVCGSGLKAIMLAAQSIMLAEADLVLAGGMENMSMAPYAMPGARSGFRLGNKDVVDLLIFDALRDPYSGRHMGEISEDSISRYKVSREDQDAYAARSYRLSQQAVETGRFAAELVPVLKKTRKGNLLIEQDEEPFRGDPDKLASLRPVFKKDGTITAGNASTINDGAAVTLLASEEALKKYGLQPKAKLRASATNSLHPDEFGEAPIGAIEKVLAAAGLTKEEIDLYEINEAFASVPLIAMQQLELAADKVNVNGGAVSIGHPVGCSGARLVATLVRELAERQQRYGLAALCIGGGEGVAAIIERF